MKIAVIGSGISGLSAAYLLSARHDVHLFEAEGRLGGHAHTVRAGAEQTPVDTGFIVYNELNYPHLTGFFRHLEVPTVDSEMTLSVKFNSPKLEWGGENLRTVFAQRLNLLRPKFWLMVRDILRFNRLGEANLRRARAQKLTLGQLLEQGRYSRPFTDWYLLPMGAAIWSTPAETMLDFPAETFLQFCLNHRLLQVEGRPTWKTVRGGSIEYVRRVAKALAHVHLLSAVTRVRRAGDKVEVVVQDQTQMFDRVIFATHPPQTLKMLEGGDRDEAEILGAFSFQPNTARLHEDTNLLPKRRSLWSAWNFHQNRDVRSNGPVSLSYWMNKLQPLDTVKNWIVTLNGDMKLAHVERECAYEHPLFNQRAIAAQGRLERIQGRGGIYHVGAWTRYGFHEDGILSAVTVAELGFGIRAPWTTESETSTRSVEASAL